MFHTYLWENTHTCSTQLGIHIHILQGHALTSLLTYTPIQCKHSTRNQEVPHCSHCDTHTHSYVGKHTLVCSCTHWEMLSSLRDSQRAAKKDRLLWEPGICHSTDLNMHIYYVQEIKQQKKTIWCFILMRDHTPLIGSSTLIWTFFFLLFLILYPRIDYFSVFLPGFGKFLMALVMTG